MIDVSKEEFLALARKVPLQNATTRALAKSGIELLVRRDDLIDNHLSGNKAYKLFYYLKTARAQGHTRLLSFGGAFSNHLYALAMAGATYGFETHGIVRGERPSRLSPTLKDVSDVGMKLHFIDRDSYRACTRSGADIAELPEPLRTQIGNCYVIPEGGAGVLGAAGMMLAGHALSEELEGRPAHVCIACGTGTSLAGLAAGLKVATPTNLAVVGFSVLKGDGGLGTTIARTYRDLIDQFSDKSELAPGSSKVDSSAANWRLISGFHAGGYGKKHPEFLQRFWLDFEQQTGIPLDPVYTVKMLWGIHSLAAQGYWPKGSQVVAVHTGGLQGRRGFSATLDSLTT